MNGVTFQATQEVSYNSVEDPKISHPEDVIVKVEMAGLCGSDLHPFFGREKGLDRGTVMGHEFVGTILEKGEQTDGLSVGDRVYVPFSTNCGRCYYCEIGLTSRCDQNQLFGWRQNGTGLHGGQAELALVPNGPGSLKKIPEGLSSEAAILLGDNFSTGYYCADLAGVQQGGRYVVIGCGTVGLLAVLACQMKGAHEVIAIDPVQSRRDRSEELGAKGMTEDQAAEYLAKQSPSKAADAVLEVVGLPEAQKTAYRLVRPGGTIATIGCHCTPNFSFSPVDAYDKNITYRTGRCPARHYMEELTDTVANGTVDLSGFITHYFNPKDCTRAYDVFSNRKDNCQKAVFQF